MNQRPASGEKQDEERYGQFWTMDMDHAYIVKGCNACLVGCAQAETVALLLNFAGKTTLIKALTGDSELEPKDQLFATLDVTAHAGKLPNNMTVIFMDTVGFISDIPVTLIDAFAATLEDAMLAVSVCVYVNECV